MERLTYREAAQVACVANSEGKCDAEGNRWIVIILTVAHLDHVPENCADDNLRFWCQRCHLSYDAEHHAQTAYASRRQPLAVGDLFEQESPQ